jgi:hypothetical protein
MNNMLEIQFETPYGIQKFNVQSNIVINPTTNLPYQYAEVHGSSWQTSFHEIIDQPMAFTPSIFSHRGLYLFDNNQMIYKKI